MGPADGGIGRTRRLRQRRICAELGDARTAMTSPFRGSALALPCWHVTQHGAVDGSSVGESMASGRLTVNSSYRSFVEGLTNAVRAEVG